MTQKTGCQIIELEKHSLFKFNQIIKAWKLDFIQIKPGKFSTSLSQIICEGFQLGYAKFNIDVKQEGYSPEGIWTFAFVNDVKLHWRNYEIEPNSIIIYKPATRINAVSEAGFEVMTFSISENYLFEIAKKAGLNNFVDSLKTIDVLVSEDALWNSLRKSILIEIKKAKSNLSADLVFKEAFTFKLLALLKTSRISSNKVSGEKRLNLLIKAEDYILQHITEPKTVSDIAIDLNVSERTLLYAFKKRFDMGPKAYMNVLKLNHIYHVLNQKHSSSIISSFAKDSGFWHMGQFTTDYKKFFGELPSVTLKNTF